MKFDKQRPLMMTAGLVVFSTLLLAGCELLDQLGGDTLDDDATKRCVITGHAVGGGACLSDSAAAALTKAQCNAQDDAWEDQRDELDNENTMTCEADWD